MPTCVCDSLTGGIQRDCSNNIGGLKRAWATEKCNIVSYTLGSPTDEITTITMEANTSFYEYEFGKNVSFYTENENNDPASGSSLVTQTLTIILNKREKTKRDNLLLLNRFKDLVWIVQDFNDTYHVLGENNGMNMTTNEGGSGTAKTDRNGYTITFVGEEPTLANTVTAAAVAAVI